MIDFNLGQSCADALNELGAVKAKTIVEYGFDGRTQDCDLVCATLDHGCILLTKDKRTINEKLFSPCTHGGIIIIKNARPFVSDVKAYIKAFCKSGKRSLAEHCVTHLYPDKAIIHTHTGLEVIKF
jgi:hypothetical protein